MADAPVKAHGLMAPCVCKVNSAAEPQYCSVMLESKDGKATCSMSNACVHGLAYSQWKCGSSATARYCSGLRSPAASFRQLLLLQLLHTRCEHTVLQQLLLQAMPQRRRFCLHSLYSMHAYVYNQGAHQGTSAGNVGQTICVDPRQQYLAAVPDASTRLVRPRHAPGIHMHVESTLSTCSPVCCNCCVLPRTSDTTTHAHCCQLLQSHPIPLHVLPTGTQHVTLLQEAASAVFQAQMPKAITSASLLALMSSNSQMKKQCFSTGKHARGSHTATQAATCFVFICCTLITQPRVQRRHACIDHAFKPFL